MLLSYPIFCIMDAIYLIGLNFIDSLKNLKIFLKSKRFAYVVGGDGANEHALDAIDDET